MPSFAALLLCVLAGPLGPPAASTPDPHIQELEREVRRLRSLEARYQSVERSLLGDIEALSREASLAERELELHALRVAQAEAEVTRLSAEESRLERDTQASRAALKASLRAAYARRSPSWLSALLQGGADSDLPRTLHWIGRLGQAQSAEVERSTALATELTRARRSLEAGRANLVTLERESEARRAAAVHARMRKESMLADIKDRKGDALAELGRARSELGSLVGDLGQGAVAVTPTDFPQAKGQLPWPAEAPVRKRFGLDRHPKFHTVIEHPGLDLGVPAGVPVRAVHAGEVAFSDWFKGYGNLVILDHGAGYYSLYAHLQRPLVGRGAKVSAGTAIGISGDTGSLEGPGLYFEIRHADQALDPEAWLKPRAGRR